MNSPAESAALVFAPEGTLIPHFSMAMYAGWVLRQSGRRVYAASCFGGMPRCLVKDSIAHPNQPIPLDKCVACVQGHSTGVLLYGLESLDIRSYVSAAVRQAVDEFVSTADLDNQELRYDGILVGNYARAALFLNFKKTLHDPLDAFSRAYLQETVENFLLTYHAVGALIADRGIGTLIVFGQYVQNWAAIEAAKSAGIGWRILDQMRHLNINRQRLSIRSATNAVFHQALYRSWLENKDRPLAAPAIAEVLRDVLFSIGNSGSHIYSKNRTQEGSALRRLGLSTEKPCIGIFTSSLDEFDSARLLDQASGVNALGLEGGLFPSQIVMLEEMLDWARSNADINLVIRIHPREDANHREQITSTHLGLLRKRLINLPPNARIIWPRDDVSSYDLVDDLDLVIVGWSTFGLECARLGIPVLTPWRLNPTYPVGQFIMTAATRQAFFDRVREILGTDEEPPAIFARIAWALRFYAFLRFTSTLNLADVVPDETFDGIVPPRMPAHAALLQRALLADGDVVVHNLRDAALYCADGEAEVLNIVDYCKEVLERFSVPAQQIMTKLARRLLKIRL